MLIETSLISSAYPSWGIFEGVREIFQNMRDGHLEGYDMHINVEPDAVTFSNTGVSLPREALLIGYTTKVDKEDQAGCFGEGLKIGSLVLARSGKNVKIRFGTEMWVPKIVKSNVYNAEVLAVEIVDGFEDYGVLSVVVPLSQMEWNELKYNFLTVVDYESFHCSSGEILTEPRYKGRVYVKDIFVQKMDKLEYGYNLHNVKTDRDRKMVDEWDAKRAVRKIWGTACEEGPLFYRAFWNMLMDNKRDTDFFMYSSSGIPECVAKQITDDFQDKYGENSYPVLYESEVKDLSHFGGRGVVVSCNALVQIIQTVTGDTDEIKKQLASSVKYEYKSNELDGVEKVNLFKVASLLSKILNCPDLRFKIDIVDFSASNTLGQYRGGRYLIARKVLSNLSETMKTLIHEIAHGCGRDGEKSHVSSIEQIWAKLFDYKDRRSK